MRKLNEIFNKKLFALIKKEFFQILRDPSSIMIAFVLPAMLLLIYMYGVNLDTSRVSLGLKIEDTNPELSTLMRSFDTSKYVRARVYNNRHSMYDDLRRGKLNGFVVIPNDFTVNIQRRNEADVQIITDGSEVNLSNYVKSYPPSIIRQWLSESAYKYTGAKPAITAQIRYWYNQDINSHYFILPGSLAITMTLIGMLLTTLVISREWERGTMEALLATRITKLEIVMSKYIPYFILGMLSMAFNVFVCVAIFKIPFRGSFTVLFSVCALFLFSALGIGLLISSNFKDQFLASQSALSIGFLPALLLSGLTFPINSMPQILQNLTKIIPTRYFVSFIQSEFMAGTIWQIVFINSVFLIVLGIVMSLVVYKRTRMRLD